MRQPTGPSGRTSATHLLKQLSARRHDEALRYAGEFRTQGFNGHALRKMSAVVHVARTGQTSLRLGAQNFVVDLLIS